MSSGVKCVAIYGDRCHIKARLPVMVVRLIRRCRFRSGERFFHYKTVSCHDQTSIKVVQGEQFTTHDLRA